MKLAIILFNLGGPDSPEAVEPFLYNLFRDPAILPLPGIMRLALARFLAWRRAPFARDIYAKIGGRSPILEETRKQADALEALLSGEGLEAKVFVAMRCWHPFSDAAAAAVKAFAPDRIVALPLYPQYSTTTTASALKDWQRAARAAGLEAPCSQLCCYPVEEGFVAAAARRIRAAMENPLPGLSYRLLLSAHGLPQKVIARGDPYQWQVEASARAIVDRLGIKDLDWAVCYQSRVGPMRWLEPSTDAQIRKAGAEGKGVVVAPIAFVSEHSETLVELDIEYRKLAREAGVGDYRRAATVGADPIFIAGLARLARAAASSAGTVSGATDEAGGRICPSSFGRCAQAWRQGGSPGGKKGM